MTNGPTAAKPIVAILSAGELGCALGAILISNGYRVVTAAAERGPRTRQRAQSAGLELLESVAELARVADILLSLVPPDKADDAATEYCSQAGPAKNRLYVDLNSIGPAASARVAEICRARDIRYVDGAIHGMAAALPAKGTMFLSGPWAREAAQVFAPWLCVKVLGGPIGQAKAFKMLISGLAKGTVALVVEMAVAAHKAGLLRELWDCYSEAYPGIMALVERLLPTYPRHAARRGDELHEVEQTMRALGVEPRMVTEAQRITDALGRAAWANRSDTHDASAWPAVSVIETLINDPAGSTPWRREPQ